MHNCKYILPITPKPTPRPRLGRYGVYNDKGYTKYKSTLIQLIKWLNVPHGDYHILYAKFFLPYPIKTPKKRLVEGFPLRKNFDCDNVIKGLCDALQQAGIILDDRQLCTMYIEKRYTINHNGRIEFDLFYHEQLLKV